MSGTEKARRAPTHKTEPEGGTGAGADGDADLNGADAGAKATSANVRVPAKRARTTPVLDGRGHRTRLRNRFLASPETLPDYELLELILCQAMPRGDVKPLAKLLLAEFRTFAAVISASPPELIRVSGLGPAGIAALKTVEVGAHRLLRAEIMGQPILETWDHVLEYCHARLDHQTVEQFRLLFLDSQNRIIADEEQQRGTLNQAHVYPREVAKRAIELHAKGVVMVHNHPSGNPSPSAGDQDVTLRVREALRAVGVTLHDHLVIAKGGHISFRAESLM